MKCLRLVYSDENKLHSLPESPKGAECMAYAKSLEASGHMLGGCCLIEAQDLNEAIQAASKIPGAKRGCGKIRPVADDPSTFALGFLSN